MAFSNGVIRICFLLKLSKGIELYWSSATYLINLFYLSCNAHGILGINFIFLIYFLLCIYHKYFSQAFMKNGPKQLGVKDLCMVSMYLVICIAVVEPQVHKLCNCINVSWVSNLHKVSTQPVGCHVWVIFGVV